MVVYHRKFLLPDALSPGSPPDDDVDGPEPGNPSCYDCPPPLPPLPPPPPPSKHQIPIILIVSICIFGAAFLLLLYFAIRRFRSRRRNSRPSENDTIRENTIDELHGPVIDHPIWYIRTVGLPQSVIDSIEVFKYRKGEGLIEGSDCTVCLSEFVEDETLRLLPKCSHAFHITCIDTWLRSHTNCPVCRAPVMIGGGNEMSSDETSSSNSESVGENDEEIEEEIEETREGENGRNGRVRVMSDLVDRRVKVDQQMEPVRRSVSEDFSYASTIYPIQLPERI